DSSWQSAEMLGAECSVPGAGAGCWALVLGASRASIFRAPLPRTTWRWCPCPTQVADETSCRSRGSIGERLNAVDIGRGPVAGVATVADVVVGLHDRRLREAQKSCEFRVMV